MYTCVACPYMYTKRKHTAADALRCSHTLRQLLHQLYTQTHGWLLLAGGYLSNSPRRVA